MIDAIDAKITNILQCDARTSNADIARQLGMAPSAVLERIRKLETRGIIQGYTARLNPAALDLSELAFIYVRADEPLAKQEVGMLLAAMPEVLEVHHIAGEDCYLVKVRVASTDALGHLLRDRFGSIPSIRTTRTTIVLSTLKESSHLPVPMITEEALDA